MSTTPPPVPPPIGPPPPAASPWRWIGYAAVIVAALLVGAGIGTATTLYVTNDRSSDGYLVTVFLDDEITPAQRAAVESALAQAYPDDRVRAQSREQTLRSLRDDYAGALDVAAEQAEVAESFRVEIDAGALDCPALAPVLKLSGVRLVTVLQPATEHRANPLLLDCP